MLAARHKARLAMQEGNFEPVPEAGRRRACRRLFQDDSKDGNVGSPTTRKTTVIDDDDDGDENLANRLAEETRRAALTEAAKRWNFDFENEKPLEGRYDWVAVDADGNEIDESNGKAEQREKIETDVCEANEKQNL